MAPRTRRASVTAAPATAVVARRSGGAPPSVAADSPSLFSRVQGAVGLGGFSFEELLVFIWFALDAQTHFCIEGLYLFFALQKGGADASSSPLAFIWREYGKADSRWSAYADVDVLAVELPTVLLMGPGALLCAYATLRRTSWKHVAIVLVSTVELVGGWYTFAGTWLKHYIHGEAWSAGVFKGAVHHPWIFWVLLVYMNAVWVVIPAILLYDAAALSIARRPAGAAPPSARAGAYWVVAATLLSYITLVPAALLMAQR